MKGEIKMKGYVYYEGSDSKGKFFQKLVWDSNHNNPNYTSEEKLKEYISSFSFFSRWATKEEWKRYRFDIVMARMKLAFESDDLKYIFNCLRVNDNTMSRKCFDILSGLSLSKTMKVRINQLKEYYGEKYTAWEKEKEEKQKQIQLEAQKKEEQALIDLEQEFKGGDKYITGTDFVKLCDKNGIKLAIKTRGYCFNKLKYINFGGRYKTYGGVSRGLETAFFDLKKCLKGED